MALPVEVQTLRQLLGRQANLEARRAALQLDLNQLDADFDALFRSGALGVTEQNKYRLVHVRTQGGNVRLILISWVAVVNGVNIADAREIEVEEGDTP